MDNFLIYFYGLTGVCCSPETMQKRSFPHVDFQVKDENLEFTWARWKHTEGHFSGRLLNLS